jgi:hypothetical protein
MKTVKFPETKLRQYIQYPMAEHWMMSWHEDREITPGMPDLHYVMKGPPDQKFRVGWLELKAIDTRITKSQRIGVEPSQHQYFRRWTPHMPIHFMVRIQTRIYIVPGAWARELSQACCDTDMKVLSLIDFEQSQLAEILPPFLREITRI